MILRRVPRLRPRGWDLSIVRIARLRGWSHLIATCSAVSHIQQIHSKNWIFQCFSFKAEGEIQCRRCRWCGVVSTIDAIKQNCKKFNNKKATYDNVAFDLAYRTTVGIEVFRLLRFQRRTNLFDSTLPQYQMLLWRMHWVITHDQRLRQLRCGAE